MAALPGYDGAGNLINSGVRSYLYDARNRMIHGNDGTNGFSITYDPMGRLRATLNSTNASTYFLYVGDKLVAEYADAASGSLPLRRYVFADGVDEPVVWYDGADNTQPKWLHADRQGSIIAHSDVNGIVTPYTYSPYGEPGNGWSGSRFRYTGQVALPEIQAYFYKARIYDPALGRFLQTDPIGFGDDPNLYAYVKGDPLNSSDPNGLAEEAENAKNEVCTGSRVPGACGDSGAGVSGASTGHAYTGGEAGGGRSRGGGFLAALARAGERQANEDIKTAEKLETPEGRLEHLKEGAIGLGAGVTAAAVGAVLLEAGAATATASRVAPIANAIAEWIGPGARFIRTPDGNVIVQAANGLRRVRIDFVQKIGTFKGPHIQFEVRAATNRPYAPAPGTPPHIYFKPN